MQKHAVCVHTCKMSGTDDKCERDSLIMYKGAKGRSETRIIRSLQVAGKGSIISNGVLKPYSPLSHNGGLIPPKYGTENVPITITFLCPHGFLQYVTKGDGNLNIRHCC